MIKVVFFDAIDTLFRPYPDKVSLYRAKIHEITNLDISAEEMNKVWDSIIIKTERAAAKEVGLNDYNAWDKFNQEILSTLGYKGDLPIAGERLLYEVWSNPDNFRLFEDVVPTLNHLSELKIVASCISNENKSLYNFFVQFDIKQYFHNLIISEEVKIEKPNPLIFKKGIELEGVNPDEALHVGDSLLSDYYGAKNAGLKTVLLDRNNKFRENMDIIKINSLDQIFDYLEV